MSEPKEQASEFHKAADRKVDQTILHDHPTRPGNCFAACVATALGLPLSQVPHFVEMGQLLHNGQAKVADFDGPDADHGRWWEMFLGFAAAHGVWPVELASLSDAREGELVFVSGPSPRGVPHQVLYRDGDLMHDPHPSKAGLVTIDELMVLRALPPFDHEEPR